MAKFKSIKIKKLLSIIAVSILILALPLLLIVIKTQTNKASNAAAPDKLEAEGGVLGGNAKAQIDTNASGGQYISFSNQTPTPSSIPTPTQIPASTGLYGPGISADALNNTRVGTQYGYRDDYRFRAKHSGTLASFRPYIIYSFTKPGYHGGNGGTLKFELRTDNGTSNHAPSNSVLATVIHTDPLNKSFFPLLNFSPLPTLQEGQLYHITVTNIDPDPTTNYVSMDHIYNRAPTNPMQPLLNDLDWSEMITYNGSNWTLRRENTPILSLYYSDGFTDGMGYMEVWIGGAMKISGTNSVREKFTVSGGNKSVSELNIRLKKTSGTDPLGIKITKSDGTIIEQGTIPAVSISTDHNWVKYQFSASKQLISGQTYHLTLTAPTTSVYETYPIRQGGSYNFPPTTYFSDGIAEYTADGATWKGWKQWGVDNRREQNLQYYFK